MSSLPPALNFAETEEGICKKWKEENSFHQQNKLADERGDDVSEKSQALLIMTNLWQSAKKWFAVTVTKSIILVVSSQYFSIPHMTDRNSSFSMAHHLPQVYRIMDIFSQELLRTP